MPTPENITYLSDHRESRQKLSPDSSPTRVHRMTRAEYLVKTLMDIGNKDKSPLTTALKSAFFVEEKCADKLCVGPDHRISTATGFLQQAA